MYTWKQVHACAHRYTLVHTLTRTDAHTPTSQEQPIPQAHPLGLHPQTTSHLQKCSPPTPAPRVCRSCPQGEACSLSGRPRSGTQHTCIPISPKPVMSLEKAAVDEKVIQRNRRKAQLRGTLRAQAENVYQPNRKHDSTAAAAAHGHPDGHTCSTCFRTHAPPSSQASGQPDCVAAEPTAEAKHPT